MTRCAGWLDALLADLTAESDRARVESGLGLEAQRQVVACYLGSNGWRIIGEYVEVESGKNDDRRNSTRRWPLLVPETRSS